jgi:hypothetical protein
VLIVVAGFIALVAFVFVLYAILYVGTRPNKSKQAAFDRYRELSPHLPPIDTSAPEPGSSHRDVVQETSPQSSEIGSEPREPNQAPAAGSSEHPAAEETDRAFEPESPKGEQSAQVM